MKMGRGSRLIHSEKTGGSDGKAHRKEETACYATVHGASAQEREKKQSSLKGTKAGASTLLSPTGVMDSGSKGRRASKIVAVSRSTKVGGPE